MDWHKRQLNARMNRIIAKTPRTVLKRFSTRDAQGFFELNADPEVMRYTGDRAFSSVAEARNFIRQYKHYDLYGYGRWSIYQIGTKEYIGFCGLNYSSADEVVDLGFRFHRRFWGQGYATETGFAALRVGFSTYGLNKIVGRARAENTASLRVLEKLGMAFEKEFIEDGAVWIQMALRKDEFGVFYE